MQSRMAWFVAKATDKLRCENGIIRLCFNTMFFHKYFNASENKSKIFLERFFHKFVFCVWTIPIYEI